MTREQYLLQCLQEECAEVISVASKYNRFGPESFNPEDPEKRTNKFLLTQEIIDVMALINAVGMNGLLDTTNPNQAEAGVTKKLEKLDKYMLISEEIGTLQKDPQPEDIQPAKD